MGLAGADEPLEAIFDARLRPSGLTFAELAERGMVLAAPAYGRYLEKGFRTPSRKVEFFSKPLARLGSHSTPPPALETSDPRWPGSDPRYASLDPAEIPTTECLKDTVARFLPYWEQEIVPVVAQGKRVVIAAHGNSLRALVKHLSGISDDEIVGLNIPTAAPLVYELDASMKPLKSYYLGDQDAIRKAMESVANQGKAKG